jgi:hypothetical protein
MAKIIVDKDKDFSVVSNEILRDTRLSIKARFILVFCLSLSDTWEYNIKGLAKVIGAGVEAVSSGLKEMEEYGYLTRQRMRDENGRMKSIEYILREIPNMEKPDADLPEQEKPNVEKPDAENQAQINININKYQRNKNQMNKTQKKDGVPCQEIADMYNDICTSLPSVQVVTSARMVAIKARWKEHGRDIEVFRRLFTMAQESKFLTGSNDREWKASFDWLMKPANMAKVLEGNYRNRTQSLADTADEVARLLESEGW